MKTTITMTQKRQATFPVKACRELGVGPGDTLLLERVVVDERPAWVLRAPAATPMPWVGALRRYATGKPHDLSAIRASVAAARKRRP